MLDWRRNARACQRRRQPPQSAASFGRKKPREWVRPTALSPRRAAVFGEPASSPRRAGLAARRSRLTSVVSTAAPSEFSSAVVSAKRRYSVEACRLAHLGAPGAASCGTMCPVLRLPPATYSGTLRQLRWASRGVYRALPASASSLSAKSLRSAFLCTELDLL